MNIGIFGGSFNPITKAHIKIVKHAFNKLSLDKLIFVPNHVSPFKRKDKSLASSLDRLKMLKSVLPSNCEISDFEIKRKGVSYTIDTIKYFANKYPESKIHLLIGSDQLTKLSKWKDIDKIAKLAQLVIFKRDKKFSKENIKKYHGVLLDNPIIEGSSTLVRQGHFHFTYPEVTSYIGNHHLYVDQIMLAMLDVKRHKHSMAVGKLCLKLAKQTGYDPSRALLAGLLHDITKCKPKSWHREFLKRNNHHEEVDDFQLHSLTGYYWLKDVYQINDQEICDAVLKHTSLANKLTLLDKILYAADKLAHGRTYKGIQKDRALIFEDFDQGFKNVVKKTWNFLEKERDVADDSRKIFEKWSK